MKHKPTASVRRTRDRHPKAWGHEDWLHNGLDYTFKILTFKARTAGSMHYHLDKTETWFIQSGRFNLALVDPETGLWHTWTLGHGHTVHLPAGTAHQLVCTEAGQIFEASTPHLEEDTYRVTPSSRTHPALMTKHDRELYLHRHGCVREMPMTIHGKTMDPHAKRHPTAGRRRSPKP